MGPKFFNLLSFETLNKLDVITGFVLGWTGFLIGLQGKRSNLIRFQKSYYLFSTLNFVLMFSLFFISLYLCNLFINNEFTILQIILVSLIGTVSSPIWIAVLRRDFKFRGALAHLVQFSIAFDNMLGVFFLGIIVIVLKSSSEMAIPGYYFIFLALAIIGLLSWLFYFLSENIKDTQQYLLILIGTILLVVGVAMNLHISILFFSFIFGLIITNLPIATRKLYQNIANAEKPLYFIMLVFIGAYVDSFTMKMGIIILIFIILRVCIKYISGYIARSPILANERPLPAIGLAHLGMGGVSLALALDFYHMDSNSASYLILVISIGSVLLTDLLSLRIVKGLLQE